MIFVINVCSCDYDDFFFILFFFNAEMKLIMGVKLCTNLYLVNVWPVATPSIDHHLC